MTCPTWCVHHNPDDNADKNSGDDPSGSATAAADRPGHRPRTRAIHPRLNPQEIDYAPGIIEHVRPLTSGPLDSGPPITLELVEIAETADDTGTGPVGTTEGPGVSLIGLLDDANAGRILTAADARALARLLRRAADRLDGTPPPSGRVVELRPGPSPDRPPIL